MFSGFSRRKILKLIGVFVAGVAAVGSIPLMGKLFVSKVQAQETDDLTIYKGSRISIKSKSKRLARVRNALPYDQPVDVSIDDRPVDFIRDQKSGKYRSYYVPFKEYSSLRELAKDIIDTQAMGRKN